MLRKTTTIDFINKFILIIFFSIFLTSVKSEIIVFKECDNEFSKFEKNEYILNLDNLTMTRNFIYDLKTFKKYKLTDIKTKKKNSTSSFIYKKNNQILTEKIGYPQFYTQLLFYKDNPIIKIVTFINDETGISDLYKCKKIEIFQSES
jgi:hypothetical protein